jgi:hypothetical protein
LILHPTAGVDIASSHDPDIVEQRRRQGLP